MELLSKAPIHEALLDFQVVLPPDSEQLDFKLFGQGLEDRFPGQQKRVELVQSFQFPDDQKQVPPVKNVSGYLFTSKADGKIVQARRDGFTFNKLRPYSKWADFSAEAKELWMRYLDFAHPTAVKRIGLRYINRIEIPDELTDLRELCLLFPAIPKGIPDVWFEYFQRFASQLDSGSMSIVTLSIDAPSHSSKAAIILDIDVVKTLDNVPPVTETLWGQCEELRTWKNGIFDAGLTPKAKELFR